MMLSRLIVTLSGMLLVVLVNWYFFFSKRRSTSAQIRQTGIQEVKIMVKGGYDPDVIVVKKGIPVRLNFYRDETADCSDTIVFGDFNVRKPLPAFQTTSVEFTPEKEGEYVFTCGMGMLRGKLIVR
ncbi:MAG: cupredoxin domain-containing protein [Candidatus Aminicenantes bacterium]|nr:cupredoxin domain-containing protein [Candidatus Aminicenantes bacterium]MDH5383177.1 cupredoxin domain-containing protein [Candidatus Aminicenantes bacterium]MDH5742678.1 cupredoxin domain-containing protein [Candidatus Aminicenantes bacterium]